MKTERWVIIDTETDGLYEPIHVLELSGQLMDGWEPVGEPFRMLLNHDVPIPPEAVAIHGYTQAYLRQHGEDPVHVYETFRDYARDYPLVAHNLSYDWNRCLEPEWLRLGISPVGRRGFCAMMLARRLVSETTSYRLDALKQCFQLTQTRSHQAKNDVLAVVELFQRVYRSRLEPAGFKTFDSIVAFTKRTPVAKCLDFIRSGVKVTAASPQSKDATAPQQAPKDEWYYLDAESNAHGPLSALKIRENYGLQEYYIWREGMSDWIVGRECDEFLLQCSSTPTEEQAPPNPEYTKTMSELVGLCRGLIADDKITTAEVMYLSSWLENAGFIAEWPASEIAQTLERILEDGVVTKEEKQELKKLIQGLL
jgi:DNA polymerase III epsilon subunit-like protein